MDPRRVRLPDEAEAGEEAGAEAEGGREDREAGGGRGGALVEGLQVHFRSAGRLVGPGDVVAVEVPRRDGRAEVLGAIYGSGDGVGGAASDVVCFRITHMEPPRESQAP